MPWHRCSRGRWTWGRWNRPGGRRLSEHHEVRVEAQVDPPQPAVAETQPLRRDIAGDREPALGVRTEAGKRGCRRLRRRCGAGVADHVQLAGPDRFAAVDLVGPVVEVVVERSRAEGPGDDRPPSRRRPDVAGDRPPVGPLQLRRAVDVDHEGEPVDAQRPGEQNTRAAQAGHRDRGGGEKWNQGGQQVAPEDEVLTSSSCAESQGHGARSDDQRRRGAARIVAPNQQRGEGGEDE